ncbi:serine hydrolase [Goodfellowiella coeruleoviolacea]|uniref:Beta-lactamase enzyme family n=1 Tax=Goodfellowiella coeruleoviolacea TaxID=334858 RepID=A0AAE3GJS6_9PSEU|nr:hypothetical protein [Goodfellowiella coeruleoviolacea]MCP2168735.1 Beta-lactamase enzyme family [Goodfellowiella coeruleoviolacea]
MGRANALLVGLAVGALIALSFSCVVLTGLWNTTPSAAGPLSNPALTVSAMASATALSDSDESSSDQSSSDPSGSDSQQPDTSGADPATLGNGATPQPRSAQQDLDLDLGAVAAGAEFGVAVWDRRTSGMVVDHHAEATFTSASLVKLLIALEALDHASPETARIRQMLSASDDAIASALWTKYGSTAIVTRWAQRLQLADTRPPKSPGRWGDTLVSARDVVLVYRYILEQASASTRQLILGALTRFTAAGSDGFSQEFGLAGLAGSTPVAVKQGWACCLPDRVLHTSGVAGADDRFIVVVLSSRAQSVGWPMARKQVNAMVSALRPVLVEQR